MDISLTDHQWSAVKTARAWYEAVRHRAPDYTNPRTLDPETCGFGEYEQTLGAIAEDDLRDYGFLGQGQDFFMGGFAGTGKSTILPHVIEALGLSFSQVAFCAPTGKAAKVMTAKLRDFGINRKATTIHGLICLPQSERADAISQKLDQVEKHILFETTKGERGARSPDREIAALAPDKLGRLLKRLTRELAEAMECKDLRFNRRKRSELPAGLRLIVVDEGSMVGSELAQDLSYFGIPIFVMGDPGQLPPIQDSYGFAVDKPDAFLTEIHRQAADNPIIHLATQTRNGINLKPGDYGGLARVVDRRHDDVTLDMDRSLMVLCGTHRKKWTLTSRIRKACGFDSTGPCAGEPILICRNNKNIPDMVNGSIYTCMIDAGDLPAGRASFRTTLQHEDFESAVHEVEVTQRWFEEHMLRTRDLYTSSPQAAFAATRRCVHADFGHVLTGHKAQGSQWDEVVVHDESAIFRADRHRWLYTAITRASERLTIVQ